MRRPESLTCQEPPWVRVGAAVPVAGADEVVVNGARGLLRDLVARLVQQSMPDTAVSISLAARRLSRGESPSLGNGFGCGKLSSRGK